MIRFLYIIKYLTNLSFLIWSIILILFCPAEESLKNIYIYIKLLQIYLSIIFIECNKEFFKELWKFLKKYKEINISIILIGIILVKQLLLKKDNLPINEIFKKIDVNFLLVVISFNIILHIILKLFFQATNDKKDKILYESRKKFLKTLKEFLYIKNNKCILINGKWGIGKTYLTEYFFDVYIKSNSQNKKWIPIWVKTTLFKDKIEIRSYIFKEIESLLVNKGIITYSIKKLLNLFKAKTYGLELFQETFEVTREKLRNLLKILDDEYIVLIVDDLDRKESKEIKEIISLIAEVEDFFNLKIIYLLDKKNLKIDDNDKDFFEKYFSKKIELHKISYEDIIKAELRNTYPNLQTELINYFNTLDEVFLDIFIDTENQDDNEENKKIAKLIEDKINTPRKLIKFLHEFHEKDIEKIEKEPNYSKLIIINTYFYSFILDIRILENKKITERDILKRIFTKVLDMYNIENKGFKSLILDNFIDDKYLEGLINQQENKGLVVSEKEIEYLIKEYHQQKLKSFFEIKKDIEKFIKYEPLIRDDKKFIDNIENVLIKSYHAKKIGLLEVIEIYYNYPFQGKIDQNFINNLNNEYFFSRREISKFYDSLDQKFYRWLEIPLKSMTGKTYILSNFILPLGIFDFTRIFLEEKMKKKVKRYNTILDGLKDFEEEILKKIKLSIDNTKYNCEGYEITNFERSNFNEKIDIIIFQIKFLITVFQKHESSKNFILYNSDINKTKLNIQEMKTVDEIIRNLIIVGIDNYHSLYSYTGLDIVRNLEHIKDILKNNKDYLYLLLSRFGLDIEGNRIPHKIYNEVIESLNSQKVDINYETAYFQGEINQEKNKIVKEYLIEQKLKDGEELKENEITVLRVDYIENNEDKLLYIGTIGKLGEENYIRNSLGEVIFYIP